MELLLVILIGFIQLFPAVLSEESSACQILNPQKYLIITADDFGASENINEGIALAAEKKAITEISVLTNFRESLPQLKKIATDHPEIGIGVHLNITTGRPVLSPDKIPSLVSETGNFYTIEEIFIRLTNISLTELKIELRAQIIALRESGITPDHLSDQHGILSLYSPLFDVVIELAKEFSLPLRSPVLAGMKYPDLFPESEMRKYWKKTGIRYALANPIAIYSLIRYGRIDEMEYKVQKLNDSGILHPDYLIELFWGNPTPSNFIYIIEHLPQGVSEIILHLGTFSRQEYYPSGLDQQYFVNRERELIVITSDYLKKYFDHFGISVIGFKDLKTAGKEPG